MSKNIVTILTLTLITIVSFVLVSLYQTVFKTKIPEATQQQIEPLDPEIDVGLLEELESSVR